MIEITKNRSIKERRNQSRKCELICRNKDTVKRMKLDTIAEFKDKNLERKVIRNYQS